MYKISLLLCVLILTGCRQEAPVSKSIFCLKPDVNLIIKNQPLNAEVACSNQAKEQGLMNRNQLASDEGMIFIFAKEEIQGFWMKDTLIPLSIAFVDSGLNIVDIREMEANDLTPVYSNAPAMYAIEANKNWFKQYDIKEGDKIYFLPN